MNMTSGPIRKQILIIMANITILRAVLMSILVPRTMDIRSVAVAYPITWFTAAVCMVLYFYKRQQIRQPLFQKKNPGGLCRREVHFL